MEDLPALTHKQFRFVQGILEGKTASDAYRAAYDVSSMVDATIWAEASRLFNDHKVSAWLAKARQEALHSAVMTKEAYIQELSRLARKCEDSDNLGAAVKATELQGKVMGHYVDQIKDVSDNERLREKEQSLANVFSRIEKENPQLAALLRGRSDDENDESRGTIQ